MARARKPKADLGSVLAEANAAAAEAPAKRKRRAKGEGYPFDAAAIVAERDTKGLSWKQVSLNLGLIGPSAARKAYTDLTGKHHSESSQVVNRAPRGSMTFGGKPLHHPEWNDDSDQDEIIDKLESSTITVTRQWRGIDCSEEGIKVKRVVKLFYDGKDEDGHLCVEVVQLLQNEKKVWLPGPIRSFRVADISSVR